MFVLRALNHSRRDFLPTYVGLRYLLEGIQNNKNTNLLSDFVEHRSRSGRRQSYFNYDIYKRTNLDNELIYRRCSYPSPSSLLVESCALSAMAASGAFNPAASVYSYKWPGNKSGHPFKYFFDGYKERHASVAASLEGDGPGYVLLTADISGFYPSTSKDRVSALVAQRLGESPVDQIDKRLISFAVQQLLASDTDGLPVGPPLSHALANLALDDFDDAMFKMFGTRYFRYVDDIALVVQTKSVDKAIVQIEGLLSDFGYALNHDKTDVMALAEWRELLDDDDESQSFSSLRDMLAELAATSPDDLTGLKAELQSHRFNLPINHMVRVSKGVKWRQYFRSMLRIGKNKLARSPRYGRSGYIVEHALRIRQEYEGKLRSISDFDYVSSSRSSQRRLRRLLRHVQCMLYMYDPKELAFLSPCLPNCVETHNINAVIRACSEGNIEHVVPYSGKTVNAFAQLWSERMDPIASALKIEEMSRPELYSIAVLSMSGVATISPDNLVALSDPAWSEMLRFSGSGRETTRRFHTMDYIDELLTLRIGRTELDSRDVLKSRYDAGEDYIFEGLYLKERTPS